MMRIPGLVGAVMVIGCLAAGCASLERTTASSAAIERLPVPLNEGLFGPSPAIPDETEVYALSDEQIESLQDFLADREDDGDLHWQLARFIDRHLSDFDYWGRTLTASQALADQKGNCMSLAVISSAFTRHLGLEHDFQLMRTPPVFERDGDMIVVSDHVRTRIYMADQEVGARTRRAIIDYFPDRRRVPSTPVSQDNFLAMFYRNLAAESLLDGHVNDAFWLARHANGISPDNPSVLNLLGVVHRRAGDEPTAERLFRHALDVDSAEVNVLHNLYALLESQERHEESRQVLETMAGLPDHNPFPRLLLARQLVEEGYLRRATNIYRALLEDKPYLHEAHWGMAIIHQQRGDTEAARQAMELALASTRAPRYERIYGAKLYGLKAGR
jgi:Flp pilus assembly protein TadD